MRLPDLNACQPKTADLARGHWATIYAKLLPEVKQTHQKHQPCPACGGKDRFRLRKDWEETGRNICSQCDGGDGFSLLCKVNSMSFANVCRLVESVLGISPDSIQIDMAELKRKAQAREEAERQRIEKLKPYRRATFSAVMQEALPLSSSTAALAYFRHRGLCELVGRHDLPDGWKCAPEPRFPALVAAVQSLSGEVVNVHRTYITDEGGKAPIENPKLLMQSLYPGAMNGAAIRLYPAGLTLAVTEGIETALAVRVARPDLPVWAAVSASGMASLMVPAEVKRVYVMADLDRSGAGQEAARNLSERLLAVGKDVRLCIPPGPIPDGVKGIDWLDVLNSKEAAL